MRLFVSVDLPDALAPAVADVQSRFADAGGLRFTDPEQAHVTMKFLGDVDGDRVPELEAAIEAAVGAAAVDPFEARVGGLGVFPDIEYISVVWLGFESGAAQLTRLHEALERELVGLGFEPEDHEFTPHITIARMDHAGGKALVQRVVQETAPTVGTMTVDAVHLTESDLGRDGPEYTTLATIPLG
jgi:2'-5' RNA ligase